MQAKYLPFRLPISGPEEERKRMGIEPTKHSFERFNGFEDRGGHQTSKRFRGAFYVRPKWPPPGPGLTDLRAD